MSQFHLDITSLGTEFEYAYVNVFGQLLVGYKERRWTQDERPKQDGRTQFSIERRRAIDTGFVSVKYNCWYYSYSEHLPFNWDVSNKDQAFWRNLKRFLFWLARPFPKGQVWASLTYKTLREQHHKTQQKDWDDVLPEGIARWAKGELRREAKGLDCVDNFRVGMLGNTGQMRRFRRQKARGCCGSKNWEAVGPDGNVYALGFNYGH